MTAQEVKDYILTQLVVPVNLVAKVINALNKIVDYISTSVAADIIPDWTNALTFELDGSNAGKYCKHPDTTGKKRIFETKVAANINHIPPTNPAIVEDTYWKEVSASASAAIPEWAAGIHGAGLVIVFHNHSVDGRGLYVLTEAARPFVTTNIETETTAGKWERFTDNTGSVGANFVDKESPAGSINGVNVTFTLAFTPLAGSEHVYLNGSLQEAGTDYTIAGAVITFATAPESTAPTDKLKVSYRK